jgi:phospholipid transport system substrate-binding protein
VSFERIAPALAAVFLAAAPAFAPADPTPPEGASAIVRETLDAALEILGDEKLSDDQKLARIEELSYARFDFQTISRLVLARGWRQMTEEQRGEFVEEFKRHLSVTYGQNLLDYKSQKIEMRDSRLEPNGDVTVRTEVVGGPAEPIRIDYRMRGNEQDWLVIDVIIEGVSLIQNFRAQTQEILTSKGPQGLIELLREKNEAAQKGG